MKLKDLRFTHWSYITQSDISYNLNKVFRFYAIRLIKFIVFELKFLGFEFLRRCDFCLLKCREVGQRPKVSSIADKFVSIEGIYKGRVQLCGITWRQNLHSIAGKLKLSWLYFILFLFFNLSLLSYIINFFSLLIFVSFFVKLFKLYNFNLFN